MQTPDLHKVNVTAFQTPELFPPAPSAAQPAPGEGTTPTAVAAAAAGPGSAGQTEGGGQAAWQSCFAECSDEPQGKPKARLTAGDDGVVAAAPASLPRCAGHGAPAWPLCRGGSGGVCAGGCRGSVGHFYYPYRFLTMDRLKSAVAIFRRMISINSGSRLLATKIDETTAGASERDQDSGIAAAC